MNTSEEMGQARDTRIHVMFSALKSKSLTSDSLQPLMLIDETRGKKKESFKSSVRI